MATISLSMTRLFPLLKFNFSFVKLNIRSFPEIRFDTPFDYKSGLPQQLCCVWRMQTVRAILKSFIFEANSKLLRRSLWQQF